MQKKDAVPTMDISAPKGYLLSCVAAGLSGYFLEKHSCMDRDWLFPDSLSEFENPAAGFPEI